MTRKRTAVVDDDPTSGAGRRWTNERTSTNSLFWQPQQPTTRYVLALLRILLRFFLLLLLVQTYVRLDWTGLDYHIRLSFLPSFLFRQFLRKIFLDREREKERRGKTNREIVAKLMTKTKFQIPWRKLYVRAYATVIILSRCIIIVIVMLGDLRHGLIS